MDKRKIKVAIGDTVSVWKWVLDTAYSATGRVDKISHDHKTGEEYLYVEGDWWRNTNDLTNKCKPARPVPADKTYCKEDQ